MTTIDTEGVTMSQTQDHTQQDQQQHQMSAAEVQEIERERQERLASEARPDGAEIDNTHRTFDPTKGLFTDSPGYEKASAPFPDPAAEDPTKG